MELGSFPIQFQIHNGLALLCAEAQTRLFFMSIRNDCVRWWMSVAVTWEILNLSSLPLLHRPPLWLFLKPSTPFPSHDTTKMTGFTPLYCHSFACKVVIVFCMKESLKAGKKNLTSHIFHNWEFCFHLVSPSLPLSSFTSLFPPLSFCWMFEWMAYQTIWIPLPYQKQGTSALKSDRHTAGGIKAMQNWNLRGS